MKLFLFRDLYTVLQLIGVVILLFGISIGGNSSGAFAFFVIAGIVMIGWGHHGNKKEKAKLKKGV
jgi:hypothetical protein